MFESIKETLVTWNTKNDERAKLQQAYIAIAFVMLIVAGLIGLLNRDLGQNLLLIAIISAGMFLVNAVVWSLLQSALFARLTVRRATSPRKK